MLVNQSHNFQVDLRGLVDLLSHNHYSGPRVYIREPLQNAVDAITARDAIAADTVVAAGAAASSAGTVAQPAGVAITPL